jgi:xanthine dehydrogenase accessory factor
MIADSRRKQDVDAEEGFEDAKIESCLASGEAFCSPGLDYFYDSLLPVEKLLILGGGHVGAALATLALPLGFTVWLADDRSGVASEGRLPAGVGLLTGSFPEIVENFPLDPSSYVVVVTRGHSHDLECLRSLLRKDCLYIGLIGSARKTRLILGRLEEDGFSREKVAGLCAPVGLDIGAETPAEIAIAILAEMIAFRRNSPLLPVFLESRLNRRK